MNSPAEYLLIVCIGSLVAAGAGALFFRMELGAARGTTWLMGQDSSRQSAKVHRVQKRAWLSASLAWGCVAMALTLPTAWFIPPRGSKNDDSLALASGGILWFIFLIVPAFSAALIATLHGSYAIPRTYFKAPAAAMWAIVWSTIGLAILGFLLLVLNFVAYLAAGGRM